MASERAVETIACAEASSAAVLQWIHRFRLIREDRVEGVSAPVRRRRNESCGVKCGYRNERRLDLFYGSPLSCYPLVR